MNIETRTGLARRRPGLRWAAFGVAAFVVTAAAGLWLVRGHGNSNAAPARGTAQAQKPVMELAAGDLVEARVGALRRAIPLTGTLQPLDRVLVKSKVAGELKEVLVREGESVRKGQVLARFDTVELQARLAEKIANLEAGKAQLALADKTRAMNQSLLDQKFISQNAYDASQSQYLVSQANIRSWEAQIEVARKALEDAVVRAPIDGVVAARLTQPGEKVPVDARLLEIVDLSRMEMEAAVPASEIPFVRVGQEVTFRLDGFGERAFAGKVERINPVAEAGSRSISVYVIVPNADRTLKGGMFASGALTIDRVADAIAVPANAVRTGESGAAFVLRLDGERLVEQPVVLGLRDSETGLVQVLDGLRAGDRVLSGSLRNVAAGDRVRIVASAARQP